MALLFYQYPETIPLVKELVIMGGKLNGWEFNFVNDPAATEFVLSLPIPTLICGLEVCTAQKFTIDHYNMLRHFRTPRTDYRIPGIWGWLVLNRITSTTTKQVGFFPFDPTVIAYLVQPSLFHSVRLTAHHSIPKMVLPFALPFRVDCRTYIPRTDWDSGRAAAQNQTWVRWTLKINSAAFMELLLQRLVK